MSFTADEVVPAETWNFRPHVDADGPLAEPTRERLEEFQRAIVELVEEDRVAREAAGDTPRPYTERYDFGEKLEARARDLVIGVCQGSPSREQVEALPARVQSAFVGWVLELFGPEVPSGGTPS